MSDIKMMRNIVNFPSDKNGCGYYRTMIPLDYMMSRYSWNVSFMFQFVFDLNLVMGSDYIRFQRQCTENQKKIFMEYRTCINSIKSKTKLVYELDDIVHGIEPHNILAYQFYTKTRRQNVLDIMKMSDLVTFSTKFLKHFYEREYGIIHSKVIPNSLPKFLWQPTFEDKSPHKKKPSVMWGGSASHIAKGGDLEFLIPLIDKTIDEFDWIFVGCVPPSLEKYKKSGKIQFHNWRNFYEYPFMMQQIKADIALSPINDTLFNYAKSDLKYLEYCAMNIPSINSSIGNGIGPYDQTNAFVLKNNVDDWYNAIKKIYNDESLKNKILTSQKEFVNSRWLESDNIVNLYNDIYKK